MLGAVAVVDVPVDDGHPLQTEVLQGVNRAQGHVIEKAEPHGPVPLGVMPRRPHGAEGVVHLAPHDRLHRQQHPAHSQQGRLVGFLADAAIVPP